jgi:hypothetical protein
MKWNNWLFTNYTLHIESYDHTNWCWAELECEVIAEGYGTANLSRLVSSRQCEISLWETQSAYCLDSFLACCALQGMSNLSSHSWALCKNGTRKYTNESVIPMISVLLVCYIFTCRWTLFVTQTITVCCVGYNILVKYWFILNPTTYWSILIYSQSNIRHSIKHWRRTNFSSSYYTT